MPKSQANSPRILRPLKILFFQQKASIANQFPPIRRQITSATFSKRAQKSGPFNAVIFNWAHLRQPTLFMPPSASFITSSTAKNDAWSIPEPYIQRRQ
ncbi:hypothetical protein [Diaphorobacter nitroreducens]|uniref:hypothetical protein n=1 Tax=Diaphorobacter nitroreducens TaxID=164759 RepID=UPI0028988D30|nr:hypothetical protein [Diaphorobacter nitroreducens]